jgi:signal recognition particle GTPase
MLETLTKGFRAARDRFRGVVELSDANIADALSDVRASLLEADVDLGIVRDFLAKVQERVVGERVRIEAGKKSSVKLRVSPGITSTKACYEDRCPMGEGQPIEPAKGGPRAMLLGAGHRTSTAAKLAGIKKQGDRPSRRGRRAPAGSARAAAGLGEAVGVPSSRAGARASHDLRRVMAFARPAQAQHGHPRHGAGCRSTTS